MRRTWLALALLAPALSSSALADGLLVPRDRSLPPLSVARQEIRVTIDGQVAETSVVQVFKNNTCGVLEADYLFPLPAGASMRGFTLWVDGKPQSAETLGAAEARSTYEGIVRRLQDPALLEYLDRDLCKVRIYPIAGHSEQKIEVRFTTVLSRIADLTAYEYPLRTGRGAQGAYGSFRFEAQIKSSAPLGSIYSPSHPLEIDHRGEREATVRFAREGFVPERDFQLLIAPNPKAEPVSVSLLTARRAGEDRGYFLLLLTPRADHGANEPIPRDLVVVVDTSGSMTGEKLAQAKGALKYALGTLEAKDRFALIRFATGVSSFREGLSEVTPETLAAARGWVDALASDGGTDIGSAVEDALRLRKRSAEGRSFQVLLLTDGIPTIGRTDPEAILQAAGQAARGARIFTLGVGDDVDAHLLDQVAESTGGASTYVRPSEDLEIKASALMARIRHPVRTDVWLKVGEGVQLSELYPPRLPDLFEGTQLQVVGRYEGSGTVRLTLESRVGSRVLNESHTVGFRPDAGGPDFVAPLWARRKVGYLLDQIRLNGESDELKDEVARLARAFGIATPYTSLLIVPDDARAHHQADRGLGRPRARPNSRREWGGAGFVEGMVGGMGTMGSGVPGNRRGMSGGMGGMGGGMGGMGGGMGGMGGGMGGMGGMVGGMPAGGGPRRPSDPADAAEPDRNGRDRAAGPAQGRGMTAARSGKSAVDLAQQLAALKAGDQAGPSGDVRLVGGVRFQQIEDVWVDDRFTKTTHTFRLRSLGAGYFVLLKLHPELKDVFALGRRVVWVSPSGTAIVIDTKGQENASDDTLGRLFKTPSR
jgi:Ca-activated chloride channel family protein